MRDYEDMPLFTTSAFPLPRGTLSYFKPGDPCRFAAAFPKFFTDFFI